MMDTEDFEGVMVGLGDALAYAKDDATRGHMATVDVKAVRAATNKTQAQFAEAFHLPVGTLRDWEQNRRQPDAPARALLSLIEAAPQTVEQLLAGQMTNA